MAKKNEKLIAILEKAKKANYELLLTHGEIDVIDDAYQQEYKVRIDRSCPPCLVSALKALSKKHINNQPNKSRAKKTADVTNANEKADENNG